jgi:hypothetical protein
LELFALQFCDGAHVLNAILHGVICGQIWSDHIQCAGRNMVLGLTPQGRPDRARPEVLALSERVSLTAVIEAVSDVMEAANRHGIVDRALASRIGAQIHLAVAQAVGAGRISSGADLLGQQAFRTILGQHLASADSSYADQQARQSLLDFMRRHANRTSADFAVFVAQFRRGGGYADRSERDGSSLLTSARFDGLSSADAALLSRMRDVAIRHGLHWAADRPDILRMGEEAIRVLARTGFTRQSHDRLHEGGFRHRDMVDIARFAERTGQNVNALSEVLGPAPGILGGGDSAAAQEWHRRLMGLIKNPDDAEGRADIARRLNEIEANGTPEQREHIQRLRPILRIEREATAELNTEDAATRADREAREARERVEAAQRDRVPVGGVRAAVMA